MEAGGGGERGRVTQQSTSTPCHTLNILLLSVSYPRPTVLCPDKIAVDKDDIDEDEECSDAVVCGGER